jgi:hypothetical protein
VDEHRGEAERNENPGRELRTFLDDDFERVGPAGDHVALRRDWQSRDLEKHSGHEEPECEATAAGARRR